MFTQLADFSGALWIRTLDTRNLWNLETRPWSPITGVTATWYLRAIVLSGAWRYCSGKPRFPSRGRG